MNIKNLLKIKHSHNNIIVFKIIYNINLKIYTDDNIFTEINKLNFNWIKNAENKEKKQIHKTA